MIAGPSVPPSGSFLHLKSTSLLFHLQHQHAHLIRFPPFFTITASLFFFLSLSLYCVSQESLDCCRWVKPLRNGKQTCQVCKHWCMYRCRRANRQESLHCSTGTEPPHKAQMGTHTLSQIQMKSHTVQGKT